MNIDTVQLPVNYTLLTSYDRRTIRERYIKLQKGKCAHCGSLLMQGPSAQMRALPINQKLFPPSFFKYPIHLHHDHNTGMTIGAVHNYCNAVLWQYHGQ